MKGHRNYGKIHRLGKEEVEGILVGTVHVQEKVDGANASIWLEDGQICMGSRTRKLGEEEFNGFVPWVRAHEGIKRLFEEHPEWRLYGEWLVRHTIAYRETVYKKFYLFDVFVHGEGEEGAFLTAEEVMGVGAQYDIPVVPMHGTFTDPTVEALMELVGKSEFGDRGEGIVLKNLDYRNPFGDLCFAKMVTESFKEDNAVTFGGNNKHSDTYHEVYVVNKYLTLARVKKIMDKIQPEVDRRLGMEHIPRVCNTAYHDMLTEEIWAIQKDVSALNFKALQRIAFKKAKQVYVDLLNDSVSVHDAMRSDPARMSDLRCCDNGDLDEEHDCLKKAV